MMKAGDLESFGALIVVGAVAGFAVYLVVRGPAKAAEDVARGVIGGATSTAGGLVSGAVKGIGDIFGFPDPAADESRAKCCQAMASGAAFEASKYCEASVYVTWLATGKMPEECVNTSLANQFSNVLGGSSTAPAKGGGATGSW
jgi:hypothetical protein